MSDMCIGGMPRAWAAMEARGAEPVNRRRGSRGVRCWQVAALLAGVTGDYGAMGVVLAVLVINAAIGFHEEHRAQV